MTINPKSTNLPMNSAPPNITMTPSIMGPFKLVLRWSGLDLSEASVAQSGWLKTIRIVVVCILICLPIFIKSLLLVTFDTRPMSLEWATILVLAFMALNGLCSALCIAAWTKSRFLPKLQEVLAKVQNQRSPLCGKTCLTGTYRKIVIGTAAFMILWFGSSMRGILYEGEITNSSEPFHMGYPLNIATLYGLDPIVSLLIGFVSSLALLMYVLVYAHVTREWAAFNEDLSNASRIKQLAAQGLLQKLSKRQVELLRLVKFVSEKTELFASLSTAFGALTFAIGLYQIAAFSKEMTLVMNIFTFLWLNCGMIVVIITHKQPSQIQIEINNTAQLLLAADYSQISKDNEVWKICQSMVDRALHSSTEMYFLRAYAMDQYFSHKVLFIAPNVGSIMVMLKKMGVE